MQELVKVLAQALVENPDAVEVETVEEDSRTVLKLHVAQEDMGRVIGKQGRIAKAIRTIVKSAATRNNQKVTVDID
ncbi:MAG: KH domain-containing protein [Selenomonadaceae bacterium]|nr:KH domain-containing protein [Selenomonadaceae bacterium]